MNLYVIVIKYIFTINILKKLKNFLDGLDGINIIEKNISEEVKKCKKNFEINDN